MKRNGLSIKTIVAIGIGSAVFVILGRFAAIPTGIPNTTIETAYAFLALMSVVFGPIAGGLIGLIGHALKDAVFYGSIWWSWVFVSVFIGFFIGLFTRKIDIESNICLQTNHSVQCSTSRCASCRLVLDCSSFRYIDLCRACQ